MRSPMPGVYSEVARILWTTTQAQLGRRAETYCGCQMEKGCSRPESVEDTEALTNRHTGQIYPPENFIESKHQFSHPVQRA
ncbi:hypothetical protein SFRURICE_017831 [Spodoptera frugiperda]|nr:hypothetical protein SFRURICE_017831 [Spodoptera frugiperda]